MVLHPGASGPEAKLEGYTRPLSDCTHFFLEFSSRDFEESSDGELLVASKYELITGMHIEKSYAGVQSNCLNISTLSFFHGFLYLEGSCPETENPSFPARKI